MSKPTLVLLGLTALLMGCQNKVADENLALHRQNRELQARLNDLEGRLSAAANPADVSRLQAELAKRDDLIRQLNDRLSAPPPPPPVTPDPKLEGVDGVYDARKGTITVTLLDSVLFDSGEATLKESAKAALNKLAAAIKKQYPGKPVRVEGHTDSDPIVRTRDKWEDNLALSLARAAAVSRYLEAQGVSAKLITTSGFGPHQPRGAEKSANRRVEVVVLVK